MDRLDGFDGFVVARGPALLRTAYLLTGDRHLAEDLVQTALATCFRHWRSVESGREEAYVRRAMVRHHASWWRRRRVGERLGGQVPDRPAPEGRDIDRRVALDAALGSLTRGQRAVLVLRFYEDLTEAQAADALGCSVGTVKSQTHRALARLRSTAPELSSLLGDDAATAEVGR